MAQINRQTVSVSPCLALACHTALAGVSDGATLMAFALLLLFSSVSEASMKDATDQCKVNVLPQISPKIFA